MPVHSVSSSIAHSGRVEIDDARSARTTTMKPKNHGSSDGAPGRLPDALATLAALSALARSAADSRRFAHSAFAALAERWPGAYLELLSHDPAAGQFTLVATSDGPSAAGDSGPSLDEPPVDGHSPFEDAPLAAFVSGDRGGRWYGDEVPKRIRARGLVRGLSYKFSAGATPWGIVSVYRSFGDTPSRPEEHLLAGVGELIGAVLDRELARDRARETEMRATERVIHTADHPMMLLSSDFQVCIVNRALCVICGLPPADIVGASIFDIANGKCDRDELRNGLERVRDAQQSTSRLRLFSDDRRTGVQTFELRIRRMQLAADTALLIDILDITVQAQEQKLHQDILANVGDAIIETDLQFRIKGWNRGAETMYGWSAQEVIGRRLSDIISTEFENDTLSQVRQQLYADGQWSGDAVQHRRGGSRISVDASISLLRDHQGSPLGAVSINRDITERTRATQELAQRARQQEAVAQLGMRAVNLDSPRVLESAVATVADILRVDRCEVFELMQGGEDMFLREGYGCPPELIRNATIAVRSVSLASLALRTLQPFIVEDARLDPRLDGSAAKDDTQAVSGLSVVIPGREEPFGALCVKSSKQRAFSSDDVHFLQAVANIIADVLQRAEITTQLRHANRLNTVSQLAVSLTHEFGTPLNVISAYAKMMLRGQLQGQEQTAGLRAINEQVGRATHLVRQLLDFSRQAPSGRPANAVGMLVLRTTDMLRPLARQRRVSLDLSILEPDRATTMAEQALQQVLSNLLINAIDAQHGGGSIDIDISIESRQTSSDSDRQQEFICISIADQGPGVPEHLHEQIFAAFFTTKRAGRGTGLGLSVSQQLIEEAGGWIELHANRPKGARFQVLVPTRFDR